MTSSQVLRRAIDTSAEHLIIESRRTRATPAVPLTGPAGCPEVVTDASVKRLLEGFELMLEFVVSDTAGRAGDEVGLEPPGATGARRADCGPSRVAGPAIGVIAIKLTDLPPGYPRSTQDPLIPMLSRLPHVPPNSSYSEPRGVA
jgi:hypothetical protein